MEKDNQQREDNVGDSKRSRRSQSKFNKEVARYECFCSKQYLSYPALYLHLKNKHQHYFQNSKNGKKIQTTKLIESFDSSEGYKIYKISMDSINAEKDKHDLAAQNAKAFQQPRFAENSLYFPAGNFMAFGNIPYQNYSFDFVANREQSSPLAKDSVIETAFGMFMETLGNRSLKEKAEIQLLLGVVVHCINQNYGILRDFGEEVECRRYTAEHNCKFLSVFLTWFEKYWLPEAQKQDKNKEYYSFFVKNGAIINNGKYKKILQQLVEFVDGSTPSEPDILKSHPEHSHNLNDSSQDQHDYKSNDKARSADKAKAQEIGPK